MQQQKQSEIGEFKENKILVWEMQHLFHKLKQSKENLQIKNNLYLETTQYIHLFTERLMVDDNVLNDDLTHIQNDPKVKSIPLRYKIILACIFSFGFFLYRLVYVRYMGNACSIDKYHQITYEANRKLYHGWDNTIIGIGQLLMDGWVIFVCFYWLRYIKNMRFAISIGVFFLFRAILLNTEKFPFPEDIVWHNPGFFSLTVPYDHTRDFFYSGHTGTLTIIALEMWILRNKTMCAVCIVSIMYMINMLTITRIHYSIDIIGAFIFGVFWYFSVKKYLKKVDYIFSIIFYLLRILLKKFKGIKYYKYNSEASLEVKAEPKKVNTMDTPMIKQLNQIQKDSVLTDVNPQIQNNSNFVYINYRQENI